MPKITEFPRLRTHVRKGRNGEVWTSYYYDMRGTGNKDIPLGTCKETALKAWERIRSGGQYRSLIVTEKRPGKRLQPLKVGKRRRFDATWHGMPDWAKRMYLSAERRSKDAGRIQFLTPDQFRVIFERASGHCELTGIPFDLESPGRSPYRPSIDRIDSFQGYTFDNVRLVALVVNQALSEWGEGPVLAMAQALLAKRQTT